MIMIIREIVVETRDGVQTIMDTFHSLLPSNWVESPIIDCRATLLNLEERLRDRDSIKRVFFHSGILKDGMINGDMSDIDCYNLFVTNIEKVVCGDRQYRAVSNIDLVFFPVIQDRHFYLICFDLKVGKVELLYNMIDRLPFEEKYNDYLYKLIPWMIIQPFSAIELENIVSTWIS
ncbi:uncharacterized protein [Rutidosis leptorrhynchoides]|uniref:uncharacterized protein n=1 Tax=Rutidosis leptorrhynchoides TaxID=125765 RepID=UPI003A98F603